MTPSPGESLTEFVLIGRAGNAANDSYPHSMKIGPAKAGHHSSGFYADGVENIAEVSEESVSALLIYRRKSSSARLLLSAPD